MIDDPDFRYDFSEYEKDGSIPEESDPNGQRLYYPHVDQQDFEKIPGATIAYWVPQSMIKAFHENNSLGEISKVKHGMTTGDNRRFLKNWYEVSNKKIGFNIKYKSNIDDSNKDWVPYDKGGGFEKWYGNNTFIIHFSKNERKEMRSLSGHRHDGYGFYFESGIA